MIATTSIDTKESENEMKISYIQIEKLLCQYMNENISQQVICVNE